ncbi:MAG: HAMP domain-containing histidine kinase [Propionibacteriaceae bacterium]|jgi:signal transduction histidine kinase|nr:HAMP domain-containing histidine kinase [Propionibacteriaceae bacterium]
MFKKLRRKVLVLNLTVTTGVLLIAFSAVYLATMGMINADNLERLDRVASSFQLRPPPLPLPGDMEYDETTTILTADYVPSFVLVIDERRTITGVDSVLGLTPAEYREAAEIALDGATTGGLVLSGRTWVYKVDPFMVARISGGRIIHETVPGYSQIVFLDVTDSAKTLRSMLTTLLLVGIAMLVIIYCISYYLAKRSIEPVAQAWDKQRQFVADASHELRTPLTIMTTNYSVLVANRDETVESQSEWLENMKVGMDRMSRLTTSLLSLARLESGAPLGEKQSFDFGVTVSRIISSMEVSAQAKALTIVVDLEPELVIDGYEDLTSQVFAALYDNAIKYVNDAGTIEVAVTRTKKLVSCAVRNTGPGIAEADLPQIFDRFYRADNARMGGDSSYGLGLAIAQTIAGELGGKITAQSSENDLTEFVFTFETA